MVFLNTINHLIVVMHIAYFIFGKDRNFRHYLDELGLE